MRNFARKCSNLKHKQREADRQNGEKQHDGQQKAAAVESHFHIPKKQLAPPFLGLADFRLAVRADVPQFIAHADGEVSFHGAHADAFGEVFIAF